MVSVIVPVYNVEQYLNRCVYSLLNQTYEDYEILLVDDGSTDNSGKICDFFSDQEQKIRTFHKLNGGLSDARNYGVGKAKGDWIIFVDSDDYVSVTYIEDLVYLREKYNADMAITRIQLRTEKENLYNMQEQFSSCILNSKEAFYEVYGGCQIGWAACGKIYPKYLLDKISFPNGYYEDSATAYKFIFECSWIAVGDFRNNYKYIRRDGSITATELSEKHYRIFDVCGEVEKFIKEIYPDFFLVSVMVRQNALLQLLNRINMSWKDYRKLFISNRSYFRRWNFAVLKNRKISRKSKVLNCFLCTSPGLFFAFNVIKDRWRWHE